MSGATPLETVRRITAPLIAPMVAGVFIISFMTAMKDISATVLVATCWRIIFNSQDTGIRHFRYLFRSGREPSQTSSSVTHDSDLRQGIQKIR